jgi:hypothetical protein
MNHIHNEAKNYNLIEVLAIISFSILVVSFLIPNAFALEDIREFDHDADGSTLNPDTNYEGDGVINTENDTNIEFRGFFSVDVSDLEIDSISNVTIEMEIFINWIFGDNDIPVCFYELTENFDNATVTWNNKSSSENWINAGGTFDRADGSCVSMDASDTGLISWNVTDLFIRLVEVEGQTDINLIFMVDENSGVGQIRHITWLSLESGANDGSLLYIEYNTIVYVETIFEEGIQDVKIDGVSVLNNSFTSVNLESNVGFEFFGNMKYYKFNDSNKHLHDNPTSKLIDGNTTLNVFASSGGGGKKSLGSNNYMYLGAFTLLTGTTSFMILRKKR